MFAKLSLILGVVATALILCLRVVGVINDDIASDSLARILGVIAILGLMIGVIGLVAGGKKSSSAADKTPNTGPKF